MTSIRRTLLPAACLLLFVFLTACSPPAPQSRTEYVLGTVCTLTIYDNPSDKAFKAAFAELHAVYDRMSTTIESSEVYALNHAPAGTPVPVSEDTAVVIDAALFMAKQSDGRFEPAIGPLVDLWGIGTEAAAVPERAAIDAMLPLLDWRGIRLDGNAGTAALAAAGMAIDLGAIAKGYAAEKARTALSANGVNRAIINLGGNVLVMGRRPDDTPWRIGIQHPDARRGGTVLVLEIVDTALVTSGIYERNFEEDGVLYHHILNPASGYPFENGLESVTIVTPDATLADALSTAVFAMGAEAGMRYIENRADTEAVFLTREKTILLSSGFTSGRIPYRLSDTEYALP